MSNLELIEEKPISLQSLKDKLDEVKKRDKELNFRGKKTEDYLNTVSKVISKKAVEIEKTLVSLGISRLRDKHIKKIVDIQPRDLDSLRAVLSGENITLKNEDLEKIVQTVKHHA